MINPDASQRKEVDRAEVGRNDAKAVAIDAENRRRS